MELECVKYHEKMDSTQAVCRHPGDYCQDRQACMINCIEKGNRCDSRDADQWIFLPAIKRARRISSSRKGGHFVGSDIFYEDLRDRKVAKDTHNIIGKEKVNGLETIFIYKLEHNSFVD